MTFLGRILADIRKEYYKRFETVFLTLHLSGVGSNRHYSAWGLCHPQHACFGYEKHLMSLRELYAGDKLIGEIKHKGTFPDNWSI